MNLYLCVESPPGYGKTTAARAIAEMREIKEENSETGFYIQAFHSNTYSTDIYGSSTIVKGHIQFKEGPLTKALNEGKFFIADELNISPISTILSICPILDYIFDTRLIIPGINFYGKNKEFKISPNFFLIVCQNNFGIIGRTELPPALSKKIRKINYPELDVEDIKSICKDIDEFSCIKNEKENGNKVGEVNMIGEEAEKIGECMFEVNKNKIFPEPWSLRDVTKLIKRLQYQKKKINIFSSFKLEHNLLFYALSKYTKKKINYKKYIDGFCEILKKTKIVREDQDINNLKNVFNDETRLEEKPYETKITFYLKKNNLKIILDEYEKKDENKEENIEKKKNMNK